MRIAIESYLKGVKELIKKEQADKGISASGFSAESLREEANDTGGQLFGAHYFRYQGDGRGPGKFPPIEAIMEWIVVKGIEKRDNISDRSLAFLIARKIAEKGTEIHLDPSKGINFGEIIKTGLDDLMKEVAKNKALIIVSPISKIQ